MEINNAMMQNLSSVRSAINISNLSKSMKQDSLSMAMLLEGMEAANAKVLENSVTPHIGGNIDISV